MAGTNDQSLEAFVPFEQFDHPKVKQALKDVSRDLDRLGRLDERTQEVYIDEDALRKMLRRGFRKNAEEGAFEGIRSISGERIRKDTHGMRPLRWAEVAERIPELQDAATARTALSLEQVRERLRQQSPELAAALDEPERWMGNVRAIGGSDADQMQREGLDLWIIWRCIQNRAWWILGIIAGAVLTAFMVIDAALTAGIIITAAVIWEAVFWAAIVFGIGIVILIFSCIIAP